MAEHFYISNTIEALSHLFAQNKQQKADIFQKETIITQTKGMNMWLASELATKNKVFANFSFISPQNFINELFKVCDIATNYDYAAGRLIWEIYSLLNEPEFSAKFAFVANYFEGDDVKRFQLAAKTADLFDQYMVYRSSFIQKWNQGVHPVLENEALQSDFSQHEAWQFWLWSKIKERNSNESPDQTELVGQLLDKLKSGEFDNQIIAKFPSVSLFGITVLTAFHNQVFKALHSIIDVNYYLITPSIQPNWWQSDYQDTNDILANCKATGQHTFATLLGDVSNDSIQMEASESESTTLLNALQADIVHDSNDHISNLKFDHTVDNSVQISSSYSPVREVEALYNYLLDLLQNDPTLSVKDISVQLTDVALYAPYIKAVFDNGPVEIPIVICDVDYTDGDTLSNALDSFFRIGIENFSNESIMRLLESKYVQQKFDLDDLEAVRHLLNDANIRLGIEGRKNDDTYLQSWNHGLTKLILGYAIKGGPEYEWEGETYYLTDSAEESQAYHIFRLNRLIKALAALHDELQKDKSLEQWKNYLLKQLIPQLFDDNDENAEELKYIQQQIVGISFYSNEEETIPFAVIKQAVLDSLKNETRNSNYISGRLIFSSLLPVRSIPYKVIAVLGLNYDSFPRKQQLSGFDLLSFEPREGDRNIRDNDKYLFLEMLLAARQNLYLSYIGLSAKDNAKIPPSLLIEELLEYFSLHPGEITDHIFVLHPLHGFNGKYRGDNSRLFTYFDYTGDVPKSEQKTTVNEDNKEERKVFAFSDFVRFFKEPVKWYYNKTLGIYYDNDEETLSDHEVFEPDHLQKWKLKFDLLRLSDDKKAAYVKRNKSRGTLPLGNMADVNLMVSDTEIQDLKARYIEKTQGYDEKSEEFELQLGKYILQSTIDHIFGPFHVYTNVSGDNSQAKYRQEAYLRHIVLSAMGQPRMTIFMNLKGDEEIAKMQLTQEKAKSILMELCAYMELGSKEVIAYSPKAAASFMEEDIDAAVAILEKEAEYDPYIKKEIEKGLFENLDTLNSDASVQISRLIFGSLTTESNA